MRITLLAATRLVVCSARCGETPVATLKGRRGAGENSRSDREGLRAVARQLTRRRSVAALGSRRCCTSTIASSDPNMGCAFHVCTGEQAVTAQEIQHSEKSEKKMRQHAIWRERRRAKERERERDLARKRTGTPITEGGRADGGSGEKAQRSAHACCTDMLRIRWGDRCCP